MLTNKEIFQRFDKRLKEAIRKNYNQSGVKASGQAGRDLFETIGDTKYILTGVGYWGAIDKGRSPNRSNSGGLRQAIYEWLSFKKYGFNWKSERERTSLSFAISRSIAKKGSYKFRNTGKRTTIIADAIKESMPILSKLVLDSQREQVIINTKDIYKNVANTN